MELKDIVLLILCVTQLLQCVLYFVLKARVTDNTYHTIRVEESYRRLRDYVLVKPENIRYRAIADTNGWTVEGPERRTRAEAERDREAFENEHGYYNSDIIEYEVHEF